MLFSLVHLFEAKWYLAGSLPLRPMFEQGVGIVESNVMVLCESDILRQVLGKDEVTPGLLQSGPWDSSLSPARRDV